MVKELILHKTFKEKAEMQKFEYEKPLIEIYIRPLDEEDVLGAIGASQVSYGTDYGNEYDGGSL